MKTERKRKNHAGLLLVILAAGLLCAALWGLLREESRQPGADQFTDLVFNEICTKNATVIADNQGRYRDYIELYNGGKALNLQGYYLTDGRGKSEPLGDLPLPAGAVRHLWRGL